MYGLRDLGGDWLQQPGCTSLQALKPFSALAVGHAPRQGSRGVGGCAGRARAASSRKEAGRWRRRHGGALWVRRRSACLSAAGTPLSLSLRCRACDTQLPLRPEARGVVVKPALHPWRASAVACLRCQSWRLASLLRFRHRRPDARCICLPHPAVCLVCGRCKAEQLIMVGDRYLTDIVFGNRNGMFTIRPTPFTGRGEPQAVRLVRGGPRCAASTSDSKAPRKVIESVLPADGDAAHFLPARRHERWRRVAWRAGSGRGCSHRGMRSCLMRRRRQHSCGTLTHGSGGPASTRRAAALAGLTRQLCDTGRSL
jgi:hypothetical protein